LPNNPNNKAEAERNRRRAFRTLASRAARAAERAVVVDVPAEELLVLQRGLRLGQLTAK
jgi:hypothetical protein